MPSDLDRPILNDGDANLLDQYDSHDAINDRETLAEYVRASARMIVACSRDDSYHMGDIQRMVGVANDLEGGEYDVGTIHEWFDDLSVADGVEAPETNEQEGSDAE